jgi:SAM-dependent methyltransferase
MTQQVGSGPSESFDFYGPQYARFTSPLAAEIRRAVYGLDLGQQGWRTVAEQAEVAGLLGLGPGSRALDIACGSGGPSLDLALRTGCRITGLDVEAGAIAYALAQASARGLADRATFFVADCDHPLPFDDEAFEAILCFDAITHLRDRFATLREWARLLRPGRRLLFTDSAVVTGAVAKSELDTRAALGFYLFVPQGLNERAIERTGLRLLRCEDRTAATATIAAAWHAARLRHATALRQEEGDEWFGRRQAFLAMTAELALSRRLSRFLYLAEKPA